MSMNDNLDMNAVFSTIYENHGTLEPEVIVKIGRVSDLDGYSILKIMCDYINITKQVERESDFQTLVRHTEKIRELQSEIDKCRQDYSSLYHEHLKSQNELSSRDSQYRDLLLKFSALRKQCSEMSDAKEIYNLLKGK